MHRRNTSNNNYSERMRDHAVAYSLSKERVKYYAQPDNFELN